MLLVLMRNLLPQLKVTDCLAKWSCGGFSGMELRPHDPRPYDTGPYDLKLYDPGSKFDIYSL